MDSQTMTEDMAKRREFDEVSSAMAFENKAHELLTAGNIVYLHSWWREGAKWQFAQIQAQADAWKQNCLEQVEKVNELGVALSDAKVQLKAKDAVIDVAVKAGKHLSDVLEHAIELGQYTEGGSTEGWAKLAVKEWNEALENIQKMLGKN